MAGRCERRPVTDQCNGHFGPVWSGGSIEYMYHYHSSTSAPYVSAVSVRLAGWLRAG